MRSRCATFGPAAAEPRARTFVLLMRATVAVVIRRLQQMLLMRWARREFSLSPRRAMTAGTPMYNQIILRTMRSRMLFPWRQRIQATLSRAFRILARGQFYWERPESAY